MSSLTSQRDEVAHTKMILSLMKSSRAATLLNSVLTETKYSSPYLQPNEYAVRATATGVRWGPVCKPSAAVWGSSWKDAQRQCRRKPEWGSSEVQQLARNFLATFFVNNDRLLRLLVAIHEVHLGLSIWAVYVALFSLSIGVNGYHTLGDEQKAPSVDDSETLKAWRRWKMGRGYLPPQPTKGSRGAS